MEDQIKNKKYRAIPLWVKNTSGKSPKGLINKESLKRHIETSEWRLFLSSVFQIKRALERKTKVLHS